MTDTGPTLTFGDTQGWECRLCGLRTQSRWTKFKHTFAHDPFLVIAFGLSDESDRRKIRRELEAERKDD